jgi:phosphatidylserine/phosphatidylglycerophosphate/cardiolipin synthase-like enzyme
MPLALAVRRGVTVDLLLAKNSRHRLADLACHRVPRELTSAGGRVWFFADMLHIQAVVIDPELASAGSAILAECGGFLTSHLMA